MNSALHASVAVFALVVADAACSTTQINDGSHWWSYVAQYEGVLGSTVVDMSQRENAPRAAFAYLATARLKLKNATRRPQKGDDEKLAAASNIAVAVIGSYMSSVYVGRFTFNGEQTSCVYVSEARGIEGAVSAAVAADCPVCEVYVQVKADPEWRTYLKFLYPNPATLKFYGLEDKQSGQHKQ